MRIIVVVGARPNFVKVAPLLSVLRAAGVRADLAHTGQHYDELMSDVFFSDLAMPQPTWSLGVGSGTHAVQTAAAMVRLEALFAEEAPDAVLAVGDVNSTLACALAAAKLGVPVIHLEAGLRSRDMSMPEEVNRLVTDQLSALLLAPTRGAVDNLMAEGVDASRIRFVGNIMAEAALRNLEKASERGCKAAAGLQGPYAVATIHRPENADRREALEEIVSGLGGLGLPVVLPAHPRVRDRLEAAGVAASASVSVLEPCGYLDMLCLVRGAEVVITDSGGLQEEACVLHVPCVTVRRNTERTVTLEAGANRLVGADREAISNAVAEAISGPRDWALPELWDTGVSQRVADAISDGIAPAAGCE